MQETGAHRGYIISRVGFQAGAVEAARATNIELVTFAEFQNICFDNDAVWSTYLFAGMVLQPFSPFIRMIPKPPFDVSEFEKKGHTDARRH
jgi:hypothetical protein